MDNFTRCAKARIFSLKSAIRLLMKIALLTTDNREPHREYAREMPWFGTAPEALLQGFASLPEAEVHVVTCTQQPMKSSPDKLAENIFFHSLHVPKLGWLRTGYQGCVRAIHRKLRDICPDIVHGQGTERECSISAVFSGYPNVLTLHGNMRMVARVKKSPPFSFYWLAAKLETFTLSRSDGVICITHYTREIVGTLAKKTWVVPNAVDASFFDVKTMLVKPPCLLCVGNIDERKNQNAFIRAMDALDPKGDFEVLFLGRVDRRDAYGREFLDLVAARDWCRYEGFASRDALKGHLAAASGLVLPSLEDNCPMVVLEAMAAGVPVAAARVGGVPDLIRHGKNGLLFDPLSGQDMAAAVEHLIKDRELSITARAQSEARERFHPEIIAKRHLEIYREVLSLRHD
jgi:glycosyltransferase involved in cell wall biosynthesis